MSAPGKGAYTDGGIGVVRSVGTNGEPYVRVIQYLEGGLERKRSTFSEDGSHVTTQVFGWSGGKAFVQEEILDDSIDLEAVLADLQEQGYQP